MLQRGFEGGTFVLIASVPGHCLYFGYCNIFTRHRLYMEEVTKQTASSVI